MSLEQTHNPSACNITSKNTKKRITNQIGTTQEEPS